MMIRESAMAAIVKRVVLVAVDGLRSEAIERFSLFNLRRLIDRGASAMVSQTVRPDFSLACFLSLMTGVSPARHGIVDDQLIAIHLPDVSRATPFGFASREYKQAVRSVDQSIGILASLSGASSGDSLLAIVADHGTSVKCAETQSSDRGFSFVLFGKCVAGGALGGTSLLDVPATILWALGVGVPRDDLDKVCGLRV
ncbi:MAG: alkaline phosphatase family protein [Gemmatimonadaceae bacterium]